MTTYSNPRCHAVVEDWPSGGKRVQAIFRVEATKHGERAIRQTTGAPKKLTYARKVRIVDGDDGRIYIAHLGDYRHIAIMTGTLFSHDTVYETDPRYLGILALFSDAKVEG